MHVLTLPKPWNIGSRWELASVYSNLMEGWQEALGPALARLFFCLGNIIDVSYWPLLDLPYLQLRLMVDGLCNCFLPVPSTYLKTKID